MGAEINNDNRYYSEAERFLEDALRHSPKRQQIIYALAGLKSVLGKTDEAVTLLEQTIMDDQKIPESYWRLAFIYQTSGQGAKALEVINRAKDNKVVWDEQGNNVVAKILIGQQ